MQPRYISVYTWTKKGASRDLNLWLSGSFTILGLMGPGTCCFPYINESQLQSYESRTLFLMTSLQYYCILGLAEMGMFKNNEAGQSVTLGVINETVVIGEIVTPNKLGVLKFSKLFKFRKLQQKYKFSEHFLWGFFRKIC